MAMPALEDFVSGQLGRGGRVLKERRNLQEERKLARAKAKGRWKNCKYPILAFMYVFRSDDPFLHGTTFAVVVVKMERRRKFSSSERRA